MKWPILAAAAMVALPGFAGAAELDPRLQQVLGTVGPGQEVAVIVIHRNGGILPDTLRGKVPRLARHAMRRELRARADRDLPELEARLRGRGAAVVRRLWVIDGVATRLPASAIRDLAADPTVSEIRLDATVEEPRATYETGSVAPEWNIAMVRAPDVWAQGHFGRGVTVAVLDTGVDSFHPELAGKWRGGANSWFDSSGEHAQPFDNSGHGTHVASIVLGGRDGAAAIGMAPQARWMAAKIFNDAGYGSLSGIHAAFQWLVDPDDDDATDDAPQVVVASWNLNGTIGTCRSEFSQDIDLLKQAGIAVVFSAGNTGPAPGSSVSPANNSGSLAVGAVDAGGVVAPESARGPSACDGGLYPALAAPGVSVRVADLTYGGIFADSYAVVSGTSFAAPHAAGALALLAGARSDATVEDMQAALTKTAMDSAAAGPDNDAGHGVVDVGAALVAMAPGTALVDQDGDGYAAGADCRDDNAAIHPGTPEIPRDGLDQDCNGHDLTIAVASVSYNARRDQLQVQATSALGANAKLSVDGYGAMTWNRKTKKWSLTARNVPVAPTSLTIRGIEGVVRWGAAAKG